MPRLLLLRHAKSAWPAGVPDRERPLAKRGRGAAPLMGMYILEHGLIPDRVLVSPARRTLETWELVREGWANEPWHAFDDAIYESDAAGLLDLVRKRGADAATLMLVGHNPGMEELAARLLTDEEALKLPPKYPTAGLAVIDLPASRWNEASAHSGTLERFVTPKSLGFPED